MFVVIEATLCSRII